MQLTVFGHQKSSRSTGERAFLSADGTERDKRSATRSVQCVWKGKRCAITCRVCFSFEKGKKVDVQYPPLSILAKFPLSATAIRGQSLLIGSSDDGSGGKTRFWPQQSSLLRVLTFCTQLSHTDNPGTKINYFSGNTEQFTLPTTVRCVRSMSTSYPSSSQH